MDRDQYKMLTLGMKVSERQVGYLRSRDYRDSKPFGLLQLRNKSDWQRMHFNIGITGKNSLHNFTPLRLHRVRQLGQNTLFYPARRT